MKLEVLRISSGVDSTNGLLFKIDEETGKKEFLAYTLEDEPRTEKIYGETRIPQGSYEICLRGMGGFHEKYAKRFPDIHEGMLHVIDVPNFDYILIHCGNTDDHTAGCLLVGDSQENNKITKNGFIGKSTNAYKRIYPSIAKTLKEGGCVTITYKDIA